MKAAVALIATVGALLAGCAQDDHKADVSIASCGSSFGNAVASLRITNGSGADMTYFVTVDFVATDGSQGEGLSGAVDVPAGRTIAKDVTPEGGSGAGSFTCKIARVDTS